MLVEGQFFEHKANGKNIEQFKAKAYNCNVGDIVMIEAKDLPSGSKMEINLKCDICDSMHTIKFYSLYGKKDKFAYKCRQCEIDEIWNKLEKIALEQNIVLLSKKVDYVGVKDKVKYTCGIHNNNIRECTINDITAQNRFPCNECKKITLANLRRVEFSKVIKEFEDREYELISTEYIKAKDKLKYICPKHPEIIQEITYDKLHQGEGCKYCGIESSANKQKLSYDNVKQMFEDKGYKLLETLYINNSTPMKCICKKHPSIIQYVMLSNLKKSTIGCKHCASDFKSGENHYNWKGGITPLHNYIREKIGDWKKDSLSRSGYCCDITGEKSHNLVVHHLYKNFNEILFETLEILEITLYDDISKYKKEELEDISNKCISLHNYYGLGVALLPKIHDLFHNIYSKKNNTEEQYVEFKYKYYNGEYNELLDKIG
jgi:hypothetical protein